MKEQLLETWRIHNKMNLLLMDNITDAGMERTSSPRGRTVYHQLAHMHNVRIQWLEVCAPDIFKKHPAIKKETALDRKGLRQAFEGSAAGIEELIHKSCDNEGRVKNFKKGVIPLTGYFISHESHHRGNILLTLKQAGENLPDALKWGLWEWGK
ncbi:MAG: hypothetical protein E6H09_15640 [Bacteroidetes bacterium]|jgi:uncharacterized damage-inducible protein DinB|nr:MAG: hypothetical protein E6H09_15640 [Bacteroidota bacterium]